MNDKLIPLDEIRDNALPYGRTSQTPASLSPNDIDKWKKNVSPTFKNYFTERYNEMVNQYQKLVDDYYINKLLYESTMGFEPKMGETYFLYEKSDGTAFLSLVNPQSAFWSGFIGKFKLNSQYAWERVE